MSESSRAGSASSGARGVWARGDYARVARDLLAPFGRELVAACGITGSDRVLDIACGTGNVALRAAETGAEVVACDITPELLGEGKAAAGSAGLTVQWDVADASALPYEDGSFDVVVSSVGAMFAPDHEATAREMSRVCRRGGRIGSITWVDSGFIHDSFRVLSAVAPPPTDGPSPMRWGDEAYVQELFGDSVADLMAERRYLPTEHFASPAEYTAYYRTNFGPMIATFEAIGDDPAGVARLDAELTATAARFDLGTPGHSRFAFEYLLVTARRA